MTVAQIIKEAIQLMGSRRKKVPLLAFFVVINGLLEVVSLAALLQVMNYATTPEDIKKDSFVDNIYNYLGFESTGNFLFTMMIGVFFVFLFKNIFGVFLQYRQSTFSFNVALDFVERQYYRHLEKPYIYFTQKNSNFISRDIGNVPNSFATSILMPILTLFSEFIVLFLILVGIALYDYRVLILLFFTMVPVSMLFYRMVKNKIARYNVRIYDVEPLKVKTIYESIHGIVDVKLSNKESYFIKKCLQLYGILVNLHKRVIVLQSLPIRIIELSVMFGIASMFAYILFFEGNGTDLITYLAIFAGAAYRAMPSVNRILSAIVTIKGGEYLLDILRVSKGFDISEVSFNDKVKEISFSREIKIDDLSFSYPEAKDKTLKYVDFSIKKGEVIGFIGESGSGKSTLIKLILGLLEPTNGQIRVDDTILSSDCYRAWQKKIGYVQQHFYMVDGSLADNVAFGGTEYDIDREKIKKCLDLTQLTEVVNGLPNGIDTNIGELGNQLSGGQRQRAAIARALYKDVEILVFDEATSALDSQTEAEIMSTIYNLSQHGVTILLIAHRISTLLGCDRIVELDKGEIKRICSYKDLNTR